VSDGHEHLLARLHLKAVFPTLAALVRLDQAAQSLIAGQHFGVRLRTRSGLSARIDFLDGEAQVNSPASGQRAIELLFLTDRQLNRTFSGTGFSLPIPVGGFARLSRLRIFSKLSARLHRILTTTPRPPMDQKLLDIHADLLMGELIPSAIAQLVRFDAACRGWLAPYSGKLVQFEVVGVGASWIRFREDGAVYASGASGELPDVIIAFRDRDVAVAAIHGDLDTLGALGKGQMTVRGLIPLADALDRVLDRLGLLLKEGQ
jgi:hypothetical protein